MSTDDPLGGGCGRAAALLADLRSAAAFGEPFEPRDWKLAGALVPHAYIG